jgi:hypothetical protein
MVARKEDTVPVIPGFLIHVDIMASEMENWRFESRRIGLDQVRIGAGERARQDSALGTSKSPGGS